MCNSWKNALKLYNWSVDLQHFNGASNYPFYFNRSIQPNEVVQFEDMFRGIIDDNGSYEIAGEVCFWKNYGNFQARSKLTQSLLTHITNRAKWEELISAIKKISNNPSLPNFLALRKACDQPKGFATPITFLAFYNPIGRRVPRVYPWVNASRSEAKAYRRSRSSEACTPLKCHGLARGYLLEFPMSREGKVVH